jgi:hypothetical protein
VLPVLRGAGVIADIATASLVASKISGVPDSSGNGNAFAQLTSGSRPTYQATGIGGRPSMKPTGSTSFLLSPWIWPASNSGAGWTVYVVTQITGSTSYATDGQSTGVRKVLWLNGAFWTFEEVGHFALPAATSSATNARVLVIVTADGAGNVSISVDGGITWRTSALGGGASAATVWGAQYTGMGPQFAGLMALFAGFVVLHNSTEIASNVAAIKARWFIP